jgi:hypothetical protein
MLIRHIELVSLFISFQTPFRRELGSLYINLMIGERERERERDPDPTNPQHLYDLLQ